MAGVELGPRGRAAPSGVEDAGCSQPSRVAESAALALAGLGPALVTPVDVPPATAGDLHSLIAASGPAVLSAHGVDGHPVRLDPPHTTGRLDERLLGAVRIASEDPNRALNLNTPDDWNSFLNSLKRPPR